MEFFTQFPVMERVSLMELKKGIDLSFRLFSRKYGDAIENFFDPLLFFLVWLEKLLITTPTGIPTAIHIIVHTVIIATVAMQSFHIPKYPISINAIALPTTNFQLLEPNQAKIPMTIIIIGQGVVSSNFSNHTKKNNNGSKKASMPSPY